MLNIAIVEDNKIQAELICKYVMEWSDKACVKRFESAEQFLFELDDYPEINVILLDIELPKANGMELAKALRKKGYKHEIIFITATPDYMQDGYDVNALHYLLKPIKKEKLFSCLNKVVATQKNQFQPLIIFVKKDKIKINQDKIIFVESMAHNLKIKTTSDEIITRMLLSDIEKELSSKLFVKTHRAFIVNLKRIKQIKKDFAIMGDGSKVPISRREYKNVNDTFIKLFKSRME